MAHRGRLAFITHVVGRPAESILAEFEGHMAFESGDEDDPRDRRRREVPPRRRGHLHHAQRAHRSRVKLAANPSHLEQVNAVAEGHTRALQTDRHAPRAATTTRSPRCPS